MSFQKTGDGRKSEVGQNRGGGGEVFNQPFGKDNGQGKRAGVAPTVVLFRAINEKKSKNRKKPHTRRYS